MNERWVLPILLGHEYNSVCTCYCCYHKIACVRYYVILYLQFKIYTAYSLKFTLHFTHQQPNQQHNQAVLGLLSKV